MWSTQNTCYAAAVLTLDLKLFSDWKRTWMWKFSFMFAIYSLIFFAFFDLYTARKWSLRRLCFYTCLSFCPWGGGGVRGRGMCMAVGVHGGGGHGRGACMAGGVHGGGGHGRGVCMGVGGMHVWWGACVADTTRYGQWTGGMHPTRMHSCSFLLLFGMDRP